VASAHSGHDRSAKNIGGIRTRASMTQQSGLEPLFRLQAALWQPHRLISGRAPATDAFLMAPHQDRRHLSEGFGESPLVSRPRGRLNGARIHTLEFSKISEDLR
jgi:hypothetical protein